MPNSIKKEAFAFEEVCRPRGETVIVKISFLILACGKNKGLRERRAICEVKNAIE